MLHEVAEKGFEQEQLMAIMHQVACRPRFILARHLQPAFTALNSCFRSSSMGLP